MHPESKRVFITGASAGIGKAIATRLARCNCEVWGTSRRIERLPALQGLHRVCLDLGDAGSIRCAVQRALEESGGIDVLVNNAGAGAYVPLEHISTDELTEQFRTFVAGPMELTRLLLPGMRHRGAGLIINITSLAAQFPVPFMGTYSAAKAASSSLSWSLEMELCAEAIRVVEVQPGDINTDFHRVMRRHESLEDAGADANIARAYAAYSANMRRAPPPERVADAVLGIINGSNRAASVTVGSVFQALIAPLLAKVSPLAWTRAVLSRYYGLRRGNHCRS